MSVVNNILEYLGPSKTNLVFGVSVDGINANNSGTYGEDRIVLIDNSGEEFSLSC